MMILALALACHPSSEPGSCDEANARLGRIACVHQVEDQPAWAVIARDAEAIDQETITKWAAPYGLDSPLPETLFLNSNAYPLHWQMLGDAFPDRFPGMTLETYSQLVLNPERKSLQTGNISRYSHPSGDFYGFTVWDDRTRPDRSIPFEEVLEAWLDLDARFEFEELAFVPNTSTQAENSEGWDAPFSIRGLAPIPYEPYTIGVGYGFVRSLDLTELADAEANGQISFQDLLILDAAPFDLAQPVSGTVTGTRQGELSHLNVRAAARGTPNCYVVNAQAAFAPWQDQLVRLECGENGWNVTVADLEEAETWWEAIRPDPVVIPIPNTEVDSLVGLLDLNTDSAQARTTATATFGSKGTNLATLYQRTPSSIQLEGLLVPFSWYLEFLETPWMVDLGEGLALHSFAETLQSWHADPVFFDEPTTRHQRLGMLRDAMEASAVDEERLVTLGEAIVAQFGEHTMMRFRSSSNAEDALAFGGAGLYDSTSVCVADSRDPDESGPSRCDPDKANERGVARGLLTVWTSLWLDAAWEERHWYGILHTDAAMGVLVNTRSKDEQINAVAFTGQPSLDDNRFLINAQIGAFDVVSAEPGVFPERILVEMSGGDAIEVLHTSESSQVPPGTTVMSSARATELSEHLWTIREVYPIDTPAPQGSDILLDTEWKVLSDGRLVVKQVRPFLRTLALP